MSCVLMDAHACTCTCIMQAPLGGELQLVDMTQAPLLNAQESIKKNESDVTAALDQLHKEYQSVKTLLDRYVSATTGMFLSCVLLHRH